MEILKLKSTITKVKYSLEGLNSFELAKERINELEDRLIGIIQAEEQRKKRMKKNEQSLRDMGHHQIHQHTSNGSIRRKREQEEKIVKEVMAQNFSNILKNNNLHIQKA